MTVLMFYCRIFDSFTVKHHSALLTAHDGAEGFCRVSHESLNLLHGARDAGQKLYTISRHCNVFFNANLHTIVTLVIQTGYKV